MVKHRRAGAGAKPTAGIGKRANFTTRILPDTRRLLEEAALEASKREGRHVSISSIAETILRNGLQKPPVDAADRSLLSAIALLIKRIIKDSERSWGKDGYTAQSIRHGIEGLLFKYAATPDTSPPVPEAIERRIAKMPPKLAERYRDPEYFGHMHAQHLIREFQEAQSTEPPTEMSQPYFFYGDPGRLSVIGRELEKAVTDINQKGKSK